MDTHTHTHKKIHYQCTMSAMTNHLCHNALYKLGQMEGGQSFTPLAFENPLSLHINNKY